MVKRIDKLSDEQLKMIPKWVEKWTQEGLRTDEMDLERFKTGVNRCYEFAKLAPPMTIIAVKSPPVGALAAAVAVSSFERTKDILTKAELDKVGTLKEIKQALAKSIKNCVLVYTVDRADMAEFKPIEAGSLWKQKIRDEYKPHVEAAMEAIKLDIPNAIQKIVMDKIAEKIKDAAELEEAKKLAASFAARMVEVGAKDVFSGALSGVLGAVWWRYCGGQFWVSWQAYTSFFRDVCHLELEGDAWERDRAYADAQTSASWWWAFKEFVIVCNRPRAINLDDRGRLHSENGRAIEFRDEWGVYAIHGVRIPDDRSYIVTDPKRIKVEEINKEQNAELRRIMIERYGWHKFLDDSKADVVQMDVDMDGIARALMHTENHTVLVCCCTSTGRVFSMEVPPATKTCEEAANYLKGDEKMKIIAQS